MLLLVRILTFSRLQNVGLGLGPIILVPGFSSSHVSISETYHVTYNVYIHRRNKQRNPLAPSSRWRGRKYNSPGSIRKNIEVNDFDAPDQKIGGHWLLLVKDVHPAVKANNGQLVLLRIQSSAHYKQVP